MLKKHWHLFVFCTIFFVFFTFITGSGLFLGGESYFSYDAHASLLRNLSAWTANFGFGLPNNSLAGILHNVLVFLLNSIFAPQVSQRVLISLLFSFSYIVITKLAEKYGAEKRLYITLSGLFYIMNPFTIMMLVWVPVYQYFFLAVPLMLLVTEKFLESDRGSGKILAIAIMALAWATCGVVAVNPALFGLIYLIVIARTIYLRLLISHNLKRFLIDIFIISTVCIVSNTYWILPFIVQLPSMYAGAQIYKGLLSGEVAISMPTLRALTLNIFYWFGKKDPFGRDYFLYASWYSPVSSFIMVTILCLGMLSLLKKESPTHSLGNNRGFYALLIILGIFLSKGTSGVFGQLYKLFLMHIRISGLYRAADTKFPILYILGLSLLLSVIGSNFTDKRCHKHVLGVVLVTLTLLLGAPLFIKQAFPINSRVTVPSYWQSLETYLQSQGGKPGRVLLLPRNNDAFDRFEWGYEGGWLSTQMLSNSSIGYTPGYGPTRQEANFKVIDRIYTSIKKKDSLSIIEKDLQSFGIKYILIRHDLRDIRFNSQEIGFLESFSHKIWTEGSLDLYEVNNYAGFIEVNGEDLGYKEVCGTAIYLLDPVKKKSEVPSLEVVVKNSYDKNWQVYILPNPLSKSVGFGLIIDTIKVFMNNPKVGIVHTRYASYANAWEIEKMPQDSRIMIVYTPQVYFYFGLIITLLTSLLSLTIVFITILGEHRSRLACKREVISKRKLDEGLFKRP